MTRASLSLLPGQFPAGRLMVRMRLPRGGSSVHVSRVGQSAANDVTQSGSVLTAFFRGIRIDLVRPWRFGSSLYRSALLDRDTRAFHLRPEVPHA